MVGYSYFLGRDKSRYSHVPEVYADLCKCLSDENRQRLQLLSYGSRVPCWVTGGDMAALLRGQTSIAEVELGYSEEHDAES